MKVIVIFFFAMRDNSCSISGACRCPLTAYGLTPSAFSQKSVSYLRALPAPDMPDFASMMSLSLSMRFSLMRGIRSINIAVG